MKNAVLLHGRWPERIDGTLIADIPLCNPNNEGNWMGWTKVQLENQGYTVTCPIIVDSWKAPFEQWRLELDGVVIDEETVLVGWSAGGYAVLRYLAESGKRVKKVVLVAPGSKYTATDEDPSPSKHEFYGHEITAQLNDQIRDGVVIFVSNDSSEILRSVEMFERTLDATMIRMDGRGHFSFLIGEFPELVREIVV